MDRHNIHVTLTSLKVTLTIIYDQPRNNAKGSVTETLLNFCECVGKFLTGRVDNMVQMTPTLAVGVGGWVLYFMLSTEYKTLTILPKKYNIPFLDVVPCV